MKKHLVILSLLALGVCKAGAQQLPYQNPNLSPKERAADLCSRMTIEEKAQVMLVERSLAWSGAQRLRYAFSVVHRNGSLVR